MEGITYRQFLKKWLISCGLGELFSIAFAAAIAVTYRHVMGEPKNFGEGALSMLVMLASGAIEGIVLGWFQWSVLKLKFTFIKLNDWVGYTLAVSIICWAFGMIPTMFSQNLNHSKDKIETIQSSDSLKLDTVHPQIVDSNKDHIKMLENPLKTNLIYGGLLGLSIGGLFGLFQWLSLRFHSRRAYLWIIANALGWMLAMVSIFLSNSLTEADTPTPLIIGMGAAGVILAGLSISIITGFFLFFIKVNDSVEESSS